MRICQIGVIAFKKHDNDKSVIGGISGYIDDLISILSLKKMPLDFVGKIYNYHSKDDLTYFEILRELSSTNRFLINLFLKSWFVKLDKNTIIHAHRPDHLAAFSMFKTNKKIVTLHGQQAVTVYKRKNWIIRRVFKILESIALKQANYILVTDSITKEYYKKEYPHSTHKIIITPTAVNLKKFRILDQKKCRTKYNYEDTDNIIQYLGRVEAPKKVKEIILAFAQIVEEVEDLKLMIIGSGVDLEAMKKLSKNMDIDTKIEFFGSRSREELPELINCADVSVLFSGNEGSPLSVKESLACGVPVVANNVGDISTTIEDGINGYILEEDTVKCLASTIKKCLRESKKMQKYCVESVQKFSKDIVFNQIIDIYKELDKR